MILQGDAAAVDDGDADGFHLAIKRRVCRRRRQTQADTVRAAPQVELRPARARSRNSLGTRAWPAFLLPKAVQSQPTAAQNECASANIRSSVAMIRLEKPRHQR